MVDTLKDIRGRIDALDTRLVQLLEAEPRDNVARAGEAFMAGIRAALDAKEQGANA